jgi:hypothetical protein
MNCFENKLFPIIFLRLNYTMHSLYLVKVQFNSLSFDRSIQSSKFHVVSINHFLLIFVNTVSFNLKLKFKIIN